MERDIELLAALIAAGAVFVGIIAPLPMLVVALGIFGLGLVTRLLEAHIGPGPGVQNPH